MMDLHYIWCHLATKSGLDWLRINGSSRRTVYTKLYSEMNKCLDKFMLISAKLFWERAVLNNNKIMEKKGKFFPGKFFYILLPGNKRNQCISNHNDAIWWYTSGPTLAKIMACCLWEPNHYLNQCWLLVSEVLWHSPKSNFTVNDQATLYFSKMIVKIKPNYGHISQGPMNKACLEELHLLPLHLIKHTTITTYSEAANIDPFITPLIKIGPGLQHL